MAEFDETRALYLMQQKHLERIKYCTLKEGDATRRLNIRVTRSDCA